MPGGEPGWRCGQPYGHEALCLQGGSPDLRVPLPQRHGGSQAQRLVGGWMAGLSLSPGFAPPPVPMVGPGPKHGCSCLADTSGAAGREWAPTCPPGPLSPLPGGAEITQFPSSAGCPCGAGPQPSCGVGSPSLPVPGVSVGQAPIPRCGAGLDSLRVWPRSTQRGRPQPPCEADPHPPRGRP